jgi:hypothetical protein
MRRWLLLLAVIATVGCSTRSVVVTPDDVSKLNDPQWTIKAPPTARQR